MVSNLDDLFDLWPEEGRVFLSPRHARRVLWVGRQNGKAYVAYSLGGDDVKYTSMKTFRAMTKYAEDVTGCEIEIEDCLWGPQCQQKT